MNNWGKLAWAICLALMVPGYCYGSEATRKAQEFIDVGREERAVEILRNRVDQEAKDGDAYWMLANIYLKRGQYSQADEQFGYAVNLNLGRQKEVVEKYKKALTGELAKGNIGGAKELVQKVLTYEATFRPKVYSLFYAKGRNSSGQTAVDCFDTALTYANNQSEAEKVGKNYLKIALDTNQSGALVNKATSILGKEFIDKVMPGQWTEKILERTYTDADLDEDGTVLFLDFTKIFFEPGDVITLNTSGGQVSFSDNGKWVSIPKDGGYTITSYNSPRKGGEALWFVDKGQNTKVHVKAERVVTKKANYELLGNL